MKTTTLIISLALTCSLFGQTPYYVYQDKLNHATPNGKMGSDNGSGIKINPNSEDGVKNGKHSLNIKINGKESWCGLYFFYGGGWTAKELKDLSNQKYFIFYARTNTDDYTLNSVGFGEKESEVFESGIQLKKEWTRYVFEIKDPSKLNKVNMVFGMWFPHKEGDLYFDDVHFTNNFEAQEGDELFLQRKDSLKEHSVYMYSDSWINGKPNGKWGAVNGQSVQWNPTCRTKPVGGVKCLLMNNPGTEDWAGITITLNGKWGAEKNDSLLDLTGYDKFEFYVRYEPMEGEDPNQTWSVSVGGEGSDFEKCDSRQLTYLDIGPEWRKYTINLSGSEMSKVNSLMTFGIPKGKFYLDEMRFYKSKPNKKQPSVWFEKKK